ncbi:MAG: FAD-dependent monooxygenase [Beijerinckiaceae bacterium]|nr:FAD-dependent monooxygenase [Beijerinckiaceae bacterium]MCZ8300518.1 FAD-dependent monooxygenase [Beijerinckiaceae bacterium]
MSDPIIVHGAGPAGSSLVLALLGAGIPASRLAWLVEAGPDQIRRKTPEARYIALHPGSRRLLEQLGVWAVLAPLAFPMETIRITDSALEEAIRPDLLGFSPVEPDAPLAHLVPLDRLTAALAEACAAAGCTPQPVVLRGLDQKPGHARLTIRHADGRESQLDGELVVAADGARSRLRMLAGIPVHGWPYDQIAIVATIRHSLDHEGEGLQHFLPAGPFAMLPLDAGRSSIVWSERTAEAERILRGGERAILEGIRQRAAGRRGEITALEAVTSHPLQMRLARRFHTGRVVLAADAAHVVHPLAGQGLNLGLADVAMLAEQIVDRMRLGLDPGAPDMLEAYQAARRPPAVAMAMTTESLNRLFSRESGLLRLVRDVGVGLVERWPGLKDRLVENAAGTAQGAPRLMRGEAL